MGILTRDAIKSVVDREPTSVNVPEWGGEVLVLPMSGTQRGRMEAKFGVGNPKPDDLRTLKADVIINSAVDEEGNLLFKPADRDWLLSKSATALDRVFTVIMKSSGMTERDVEDLTGN